MINPYQYNIQYTIYNDKYITGNKYVCVCFCVYNICIHIYIYIHAYISIQSPLLIGVFSCREKVPTTTNLHAMKNYILLVQNMATKYYIQVTFLQDFLKLLNPTLQNFQNFRIFIMIITQQQY